MFFRKGYSFVVVFYLLTTVTAQTPPSADETKARVEREQKAFVLLNRTIDDAASLKLPENRVYIFAAAADLLWTRDEKRARQLFRQAAGEIRAVIAQSEEDYNGLPEDFSMMQSTRNQLLNQVADRDAELAIELLRQTRPAILDQTLNLPAAKMQLYRNLYLQARNELEMEKQFGARIIKQNPRRALEIARANLSKSVSYSDLNLINELKINDAEAASQFADEVVQKLATSDFSDANNYNDRNLTAAFLTQFWSPSNPASNNLAEQTKSLQINQTALRQLATKYANYFSSGNFQAGNYGEIENALPALEKILPERVAALRQKSEKLKQNYSFANPQTQFWEKLNQMQSNNSVSPETMMAEANKFPVEMRSQIYSAAASKAAQTGNYAGVRQMLSLLPGKQARQSALFQLDQQTFYNYLSQEKYAEAEQIIAEQTDNSRKIAFLVQMSGRYNSKKEIEKAEKFLSEAISMINQNPEDGAEMYVLMQVLGGSAAISPSKTFDLLESFIPKFNELLAANAFLSKYQENSGTFRDGELVLANGNGGFYISSQKTGGIVVSVNSMGLDLLAKSNLERTINLADRFERNDVRLAARLILVRGVLSGGAVTADSIYQLPIEGRATTISAN